MELSYSSISLALNSKQERERLIVKGVGIGAEVIEGKIQSQLDDVSKDSDTNSKDVFDELL